MLCGCFRFCCVGLRGCGFMWVSCRFWLWVLWYCSDQVLECFLTGCFGCDFRVLNVLAAGVSGGDFGCGVCFAGI